MEVDWPANTQEHGGPQCHSADPSAPLPGFLQAPGCLARRSSSRPRKRRRLSLQCVPATHCAHSQCGWACCLWSMECTWPLTSCRWSCRNRAAHQAKARPLLPPRPGPCTPSSLRNLGRAPHADSPPRPCLWPNRGLGQTLCSPPPPPSPLAPRVAPAQVATRSAASDGWPIAPQVCSTWPSIPCGENRPESNKAPPGGAVPCLGCSCGKAYLTVSFLVVRKPSAFNV